MCLAASKQGWPHCCPTIVVDGLTLKARFGGMLLAACGHDIDGSIFSLASSIIPSKSNESTSNVYLDVNFSICVQHLAPNLKTSTNIIWNPSGIVTSTCKYTFCKHILKNGREHTSMDGGMQSGQPNIAESLNSVDRKVKLIPVGFFVEWLKELRQRWFVDRREDALKLISKLVPKVDQISCPHAMTVCNHRRIDSYNYCSHYYTKEALYAAYEPVVHPIGSTESWDVFKEVRSQVVNPPKMKRGSERPKVIRILSQDEKSEIIRCSRCHGYEHNRQTYTNPVSLCTGPTTRSQRSSTSQNTVM
ncbi:hypothetical protein TIFTF001_017479 [Ficus carica]|uniref:Uncharacterized protein n=1 Tax=Ficus carica TaxID=3494 RepID=A0AA88AAQ5_FICCA|nr:hypothetical protein TIFTF001_017479 [Ficus carica]